MVESELLIGLVVHEVVKVAVGVEILHFASLNMCGGIFVGGAESPLENGTGHDILEPGTDKCRTLAGLNMLEISNAPNLSVDFDGNAFSKITC